MASLIFAAELVSESFPVFVLLLLELFPVFVLLFPPLVPEGGFGQPVQIISTVKINILLKIS